MASGRRRVADDGRQTLGKIRRAVEKGNIEALFEDHSFAFELIDVLYEDGVDVTIKTEFLTVLEQYGSDNLDSKIADQVTQRLMDVLKEQKGSSEYPRFLVQLMLTLTSLIIQNDMLKTDVCESLVSHLWKVMSKVNDVGSRPLRGCACQCLRQLETWHPGLLSRYKDRLVKMMRDERTHVFQDYATLLSTVLTNLSHTSTAGDRTSQDSISAEDIVPPLSFLMENAFLFTPAGLWPIVLSVMEMVKMTPRVSPTIFKPLMLQNMASLDPCMLHIVLCCQREFQGEICTAEEERLLLRRLASEVSLLTLHPALRLLMLQWLKAYLQHSGGEVLTDSQLMTRLQRSLCPTVFDSLDIHVDKLTVLTTSYSKEQDHNLLRDIHYLKRLSLTTGNERATAGLYRVLFDAYTHHQTQHVADTVIKITGDLVVDYPHLIPLILDFLLAVKETLNDSSVYLATLSSLHSQVLNARQVEVLAQFRFFLQVLSVSATQPDIQQQKTIQFLLRLVVYAEEVGVCEWELGCAVLTICRKLLLHHPSDYIYYDLGELLYEMQSCFSDTDIRNRARLLYALLAGASDDKIREVLGSKLAGGGALSQNITNILTGSSQKKGKAEIVHTEEKLLHWERLFVAPVFTTLESPSEFITVPDVSGQLESYFRHLKHLDSKIVYQYKLCLDEASQYEEVSAVGIRVQSSAESFLPVPDINLMSLTKLGSKEVGINLVPTLPQPCVFSIQVMFSTQDYLTVSTTLPPIEVTFSDLIMVLPWQQLGVAEQQDKHRVFDELWTMLTGSGSGESNQGVESVKVLKCTADKIRRALKDFQVPAIPDQTVDKFILFLPPCFHVLLRVFPQASNQVVSIATDHWKILPCLSNFLNSVESSS
ncbi:AP-5 complex subunit beta-1-like [Babylonia areolata]|uniref:AP-5 complex subunit beta-1-like n=1 Tax=Babylonia areolata TaxID=304850 RepID=UPI003FD13176